MSACLRGCPLASWRKKLHELGLPAPAPSNGQLADVEDDRHARQDPLGGRLFGSQLGHEDEVRPGRGQGFAFQKTSTTQVPPPPACRHTVRGAHVHVLVFLLLLQAGLSPKHGDSRLLRDSTPPRLRRLRLAIDHWQPCEHVLRARILASKGNLEYGTTHFALHARET